MSDNGHFIDYVGTINHVAADAVYLQGDNTKVFWLDQEFATTGDDGAVDIRRYGVFSTNTSTYSGNTYPKLWQYTGWTRRIDDSTHQTGFSYSAPRVASLNQGNIDGLNNSNKAYIYIVNQVYDSGGFPTSKFNGGIVRLTYDNTTTALNNKVITILSQELNLCQMLL